MYSVKQASEILNVTPRAIQLKCRKANVIKIGNEFQITEEIIETWKKAPPRETKANISTEKSSHRSTQKSSLRSSLNYYLIIVFFLVAILFYLQWSNTQHQLEGKNEIIKATTDAKEEIKATLTKENDYLKSEVKMLQQQNTILKDSLFKVKP